MTGRLGMLNQTVYRSPLDLQARRRRLTHRIACCRKARLTLGRLQKKDTQKWPYLLVWRVLRSLTDRWIAS